ncbi:hypothetical protein [Salinisphaera orenii]|uniref:Uncharacterized protein n=1 Tax=Salinisphaera orenii YIM 95161 TaxID=1051139 RepID=A0A423PRQ1_9GAMM|nr:hypothetical protein [Salinisphaera halophila]ROO28274.1 hypothetical protein SAHL_10770 [Salinisphaera halophila YIM 95161]
MGWRAVVELLNRAGRWIDAWLRRRRASTRQAERDRLEADPGDWYRDHFGGVHDDAEPQSGTDGTDADDRRESE